MRRKSIAKILLFSALSVTVVSCEQEFTEMGSDIIGNDLFGFDKYVVQNIEIANGETISTNTLNLPVNNFGVYTDNTFGKTAAHFVTEIEMGDNNDLSSFGD